MKIRIPIDTKNSIYFIVPAEVVYCKSDNSSTIVFFENNDMVSISLGINDFEKQLAGYSFIRPHQSYIVNSNFIKLVDMTDDYKLVLTNNMNVPIASQQLDVIVRMIQTAKLKGIETNK